MSEEKVEVTARVRVVLDIPLTQPWAATCPLDRIWEQASRQAVGIVHRSFEGHHGARIIGKPQVIAVFVPEGAA